jgi:uncharacterized iron-regulated membrane protein
MTAEERNIMATAKKKPVAKKTATKKPSAKQAKPQKKAPAKAAAARATKPKVFTQLKMPTARRPDQTLPPDVDTVNAVTQDVQYLAGFLE